MNKTETIKITGMSCAACSAALSKALSRADGVIESNVNFATAMAKITFDTEITSLVDIEKIVTRTGFGIDKNTEKELSDKEYFYIHYQKKMIISWLFAGPLMIAMMLCMLLDMHLPSFYSWIAIVFSLLVFILPGRDTFKSAYKSTINLTFNMDVLIALGAIAAFGSGVLPGMIGKHSFIEIGSMIMAIHLTGRYIEAKTKGKTSEAIRKLMQLGAKSASILKDGNIIEIPISELQLKDIMVIKPGAKIPTDGIVVSGESFIDESMATGESMPVRKTEGHSVLGATINGTGSLEVEVTKLGKDTFLSQMISLVEHAQNTKVPVQAFADKVTSYFVPIVILISICSFIAHYLLPELRHITGSFLPFRMFGMHSEMSPVIQALFASISVLVIACPCALGLATPTSVMAGIGLGTKHGILFRNGEAVQIIKKAKTIIFDKTGTLTEGKPVVTDLEIMNKENEQYTLNAIYALEKLSEHPLAQAIINKLSAEEWIMDNGKWKMEGIEAVGGKGVKGLLKGSTDETVEWRIGSYNYMKESNVDLQDKAEYISKLQREAKTIVLAAANNRLEAIIAISDQIKADAFSTIETLHKMNIKTVMLTGDNIMTAKEVASKLGISEVKAEVLPAQKLQYVQEYQKEGVVIMVGDGINDAPALKQADVSIAIGGGTDIAIESADIVLIRNEVFPVVKAIVLANMIFKTIKQNLFWAFFYNVTAIPLAFCGLLHPIVAEIAMAMSSICVVSNANRLRNKQLKGL